MNGEEEHAGESESRAHCCRAYGFRGERHVSNRPLNLSQWTLLNESGGRQGVRLGIRQVLCCRAIPTWA